jgi:hypothetical protein
VSYIVGVEQMGSAVPEREAKILAKDLLGRLSLTLEVPRTRITRELPLIGLLRSSSQHQLRSAVVFPILPAALTLEPLFVLLAIGHGGAFEGGDFLPL